MIGKTAALFFLGISIIIVVLLLTETISALVSGILFAITLAGLGLASNGFRK